MILDDSSPSLKTQKNAAEPTRMIGLASMSPRRRELLEQINVYYRQIVVNVDETPLAGETPETYVTRLALTKARAGRLATQSAYPILGADTAVVVQGLVLGKPVDAADAQFMLTQLSGRTHQVMSAIAVVTPVLERSCISISQVHFRSLTAAEIEAYVATGEPLDKAGAYAIQGRGSIFIEHLQGSYSGVMGLPLYETATLLSAVGITLL